MVAIEPEMVTYQVLTKKIQSFQNTRLLEIRS